MLFDRMKWDSGTASLRLAACPFRGLAEVALETGKQLGSRGDKPVVMASQGTVLLNSAVELLPHNARC